MMRAFAAQFGAREFLVAADAPEAALDLIERHGGPPPEDLLERGDFSEVEPPPSALATLYTDGPVLERPVWARRPIYGPVGAAAVVSKPAALRL